MSAPSSMQGRQSTIGGGRTEQIYFTHCLPGDSLRNEVGYSIRATSTGDTALLDFAARFTAYELPLDLWGETPAVEETPRRLALVPGPSGLSALVHTSYLREDTRGRKHSYFSHFLFRAGITPEQALESWASADWMPEYPPRADKQLHEFPGGLPRPGPLDERAFTDFLRGEVPTGAQPLARVCCPARLPRDPRRRQEMMRLALQASLLTLRAGAGAPRGRFYVLAEPGLAALLFYGVARLLPRGLARTITFSTYENMHSALKPFRLAQLIATWTPNPSRGLDLDYHQTRGYALDTFNDKASPELQVNVPPGLERLVALAAEGRWAVIRRAHELLGPDAASFDQLGVVLDVIDVSGRLEAGQADDDDLIWLKGSPWGQEALRQHAGTVWPMVRAHAAHNERLRREFRDLLWENRDELKADVAEALGGAAVEPWRQRWEFYKKVLADQGAAAEADFLSLLPATNGHGPLPVAPAFRLPLLQEWQRLNDGAGLSPAIVPLLTSARDADLEPLWHSDLPAEWSNLAVMSVLLGTQHAPTALALLRAADESRLASFLQTLRGRTKDREEPREKVLLPLAKGAPPELLARLFRAGLSGSPAFILQLLNAAEVFEPTWSSYWRQEQSLELLFRSMKGHAGDTMPIWKWFTDQIDDSVLIKGDAGQRQLLERLEATRTTLGSEVPEEIGGLIHDWVMLRQHFDPSYHGPRFPPKELRKCCERLGLDPINLLREDFERFVLPQGAGAINRFEETFHGFLPVEASYQNANWRLDAWLKVVKVCKDLNIRAGYQEYYLEKFVDPQHRLGLANDAYRNNNLEKRAMQKVRDLAAQAQAEEEARAADLAVPAPARLEDHPGMDPALARHLKGHRSRGPGRMIVLFVMLIFIIIGGAWGLVAALAPSIGGDKDKRAEKDSKDPRVVQHDRDKGGRDRDKDKTDGGKPGPEVKLPAFETQSVKVLIDAVRQDVGASLLAATPLKGDEAANLKRDLKKLNEDLGDEQKKIQEDALGRSGLTIKHDTTTVKGWENASKELNDICNNVKKLADKHYDLQKKLHELLKQSTDRPPPVDEAAVVRKWIDSASPSVLAGLVETYAIEWCGLKAFDVENQGKNPQDVQSKLGPVLARYILDASRQESIKPEASKTIRKALMELAMKTELKPRPVMKLTEEQKKHNRKEFKEKIDGLKEAFKGITVGDEQGKIIEALSNLNDYLSK
jgi:hypothetical protein